MSWGVYEITSSEGGVRLINGIAHLCSIGAYINKFIHCMLCSDVCCIAEIILQRPIGSALYWALLVKVLSGLLPDCLSICPGSAYVRVVR